MHNCAVLIFRQLYWLFIYAYKYIFPQTNIAKTAQQFLICSKKAELSVLPTGCRSFEMERKLIGANNMFGD